MNLLNVEKRTRMTIKIIFENANTVQELVVWAIALHGMYESESHF
jgi:hypothetical protein